MSDKPLKQPEYSSAPAMMYDEYDVVVLHQEVLDIVEYAIATKNRLKEKDEALKVISGIIEIRDKTIKDLGNTLREILELKAVQPFRAKNEGGLVKDIIKDCIQTIEKQVEELKSFKKASIVTIKHERKIHKKQLEGCRTNCRDDAYKLLMAVPTPISPDDFDKLIDDMKMIGEDQPS